MIVGALVKGRGWSSISSSNSHGGDNWAETIPKILNGKNVVIVSASISDPYSTSWSISFGHPTINLSGTGKTTLKPTILTNFEFYSSSCPRNKENGINYIIISE